MTRALALALPFVDASRIDSMRIDSIDLARRAIVLGCAASLIFAGQALPF